MLKVLPSKKEVKDFSIEMTFPNEAAAKVASNMIQEAHVQSLRLKVIDNLLSATLSPEVEQTVRTGSVEQA